MIVSEGRAGIRTAPARDAQAEVRGVAEAVLRRELPLDAWFLFVEPRPGGVRVTGLGLTEDTPERARRALKAVPGIGAVETDLLPVSGWPRAE